VDDGLTAELADQLARLGYDEELPVAFARWSGNENLEERVDGIEHIDPVVLRALREAG
jgi:Putative peptidoglycan binding domain